MKKNSRSTSSKLCHCMKAPLRVLRRIGDLYVKGLIEFSKRMHHGAVMGCPAGVVYPTSNSFGKRSKEDQALREMLSRRKIQTQTRPEGLRFCRLGIGRIDEDRPCYFPEDFKVDLDKGLYPRRR